MAFCLQTTSARCCNVDHRFGHCCPVPYAGRWLRWDVEQLLFTVVDIDLCGCWPPLLSKSHGSLRSFSLTGTIFLSIPSHFARIQSSRSQYFTRANHLSCGFYLNFEGLLQKPPYSIRSLLIGSTAVTSQAAVNSDARSIQNSFKIFEYAAKQACKELQCIKAKLLEPASINGLHIHRGLASMLIIHIRWKYRWAYQHCYKITD